MANNFGLAMSGRVLIGIGVGIGLSIDALYISEIAPPTHRGHLVSLTEVAINFGILLGFVADYAFLGVGPGLDWRLMLGLGMVMPSILILLSLTIMPESPRWLLMQGRREEAMVVLRKTYVEGSDIEGVAAQIEYHIQADLAADAHSSWHAIFRPTRPVQMMLMAGIGLAACQQLTGCESLIYYSPIFLGKAGFVTKNAAFGMTILVGASKTVFCIVAALYVDQAGRRPLLFMSTAGLFVFLVVMAVACRFESLGWLMVVGMCAYVAFFSLGVGPLTWVGTTEVFSTRIRAKAMSLATSTNRLIGGVVASTTLPLVEVRFVGRGGGRMIFFCVCALAHILLSAGISISTVSPLTGPPTLLSPTSSSKHSLTHSFIHSPTLSQALTPTGYFLFYACITLCTAAYLYAFFPETKNKTLEEVEEYFESQSAKEEEAKRRRKEGNGARGGGTARGDTEEEVGQEVEAGEVEGRVVEVR